VTNALKGRKIYFGSLFQRVQSMVGWLHRAGPGLRQSIMEEGHDRTELLTSWQPGNRERGRETEREKGARDKIKPQRTHPQ
jgi:hypothetical protein